MFDEFHTFCTCPCPCRKRHTCSCPRPSVPSMSHLPLPAFVCATNVTLAPAWPVLCRNPSHLPLHAMCRVTESEALLREAFIAHGLIPSPSSGQNARGAGLWAAIGGMHSVHSHDLWRRGNERRPRASYKVSTLVAVAPSGAVVSTLSS